MGHRAASDSLELVLEVLEGEGVLQDLNVGGRGGPALERVGVGGGCGQGGGEGEEEGGAVLHCV